MLQNPPARPDQAYAWLVLPDLTVESFVDYPSIDGDPRGTDPETARTCFGGTVAPTLNLALQETRTVVK